MGEKISFGDAAQIHFIKMNNSPKHPKLGTLYAHTFGCIGVPSARILDVVLSIFEGFKEVFGSIVWRNHFSASRGVDSLKQAFIDTKKIPKDCLYNLIDPNWNEQKKVPSKEDPPKKTEPPKDRPPNNNAEPQPPRPFLADIRTVGQPDSSVNLRSVTITSRPVLEVSSSAPTSLDASSLLDATGSRVEEVSSSMLAQQNPTEEKAQAVEEFRSAVLYAEEPLTPQTLRAVASEIHPTALESTVLRAEDLLLAHPDDPEGAQDAIVEFAELRGEDLKRQNSPAPRTIFTTTRTLSTAELIEIQQREAAAQTPPSVLSPDQPPSASPAPNPWGSLRPTLTRI